MKKSNKVSPEVHQRAVPRVPGYETGGSKRLVLPALGLGAHVWLDLAGLLVVRGLRD